MSTRRPQKKFPFQTQQQNASKVSLQEPVNQARAWNEMPHGELYKKAFGLFASDSLLRAERDSQTYILRPRLPAMQLVDHDRYVELECAEIVERLRSIVSAYRNYFQNNRCQLRADLIWALYTCAIKQYAMQFFRESAAEYVFSSRADLDTWEALFGGFRRGLHPAKESEANALFDGQALPGLIPPHPEGGISRKQKILSDLKGLANENNIKMNIDGGLFGRSAQQYLADEQRFQLGLAQGFTLTDRLRAWDRSTIWTGGLAKLVEVCDRELVSDFSRPLADGRPIASSCSNLTPLRKIVYARFQETRLTNRKGRNFGRAFWLSLLTELDQGGTSPKVLPAHVRAILLKKNLNTWEECFKSHPFTLTGGGLVSPKRVVCRFLLNEEASAARQLNKSALR